MTDIDAIINEAEDLIENIEGNVEGFMIWPTDCDISTHISNAFSKMFDVSLKRYPCYAFYIPEEKQEEIRKINVKLPEG